MYYNRAGLAVTYGVKTQGRLKAQTSVSGKSVDPDEPKTLVKQIASSARGCRWLIQEWTALKERLEGSKFWQSIDRFQAIRLLGKQPIEAGKKRLIAEIYAASHGIEPARKKEDLYDPDRPELEPFRDLVGDMTSDQMVPFVEKIRVRWPDLVCAKDRERCREILVELVDRELKRLTAKLRKHKRNTEKNGRKSVDKSRFNPSSDGELMHKYVLRYRSSLNSMDRTYEKMRKRDLAERKERQSGEWRAEGGEGSWERDTAWARQVYPGDVQACGGLLPKRVKVEGGGGSAEGEASGGVPLDSRLAADRVGDGVVGRGDLGADGVEMGVAAGAVDSGLAANGMRSMAATQEAEGGVGGSGGDGGFDNNESEVTDEAKIDEGAVAVQETVSQEVMADSSGALGLDKDESAVTNEPNFDQDAVGVQKTVDQGVTADSGSVLGLDKIESSVTNEPNFDADAVEIQETENQEVMARFGE